MLRTPRAGLSSSVDTQHRLDKSSAPLSDDEAKKEETPLFHPKSTRKSVLPSATSASGPRKVNGKQVEDFTSSEEKKKFEE